MKKTDKGEDDRDSTLEEHDWPKSLFFIVVGWYPWIK